MEEYLIRLCHCGLSIGKVYEVLFRLVKEGGYHALECFIAELEEGLDVGRVS